MGVKVAAGAASFQWSQPIVPHSPSSSQTLASAISSPSSSASKRRCRSDAGPLVCRHVQKLDRFALFGTSPTNLHRSRSFEYPKSRTNTVKRASSTSLDAFSDEEFSKKIQELALRFQLSDDEHDQDRVNKSRELDSADNFSSISVKGSSIVQNQRRFGLDSVEPLWLEIQQEPPDWCERDVIPSSIERKANSVELPLSLRMIKRKLQWQEGFREAGESAYCSVRKAFSSMVFIISELHSYTLQMRELLFTEDLQGVLVRVQKEMHASFVWLFQQVFSHTPTLMVYVMILLANFTVYSMGSNFAIAASPPPAAYAATTETMYVQEIQDQHNQKFDSSSVKSLSISSSGGKSTSVGGNNGGGGKVRPIGSGTDGGDSFDRSNQFRIVPDGASQLSSPVTSGEVTREEELSLWNSIVDEARKMQDPSLDHESMQRLVSPIKANVEADDYSDYLRTELLYQTGLSHDSNNPLLLTNYAQFLCLVAQDYDRAEEYFKRAIAVEPADAEAYSKYANFLWRVRNDLWAAEETFLEAINADPSNTYYAGNYAHFLWNTGGEDTCFPINSQEENHQEV
ncbi:uncharacterized protein LOC126686874 [Mercurialis annua]|uniref:uncharacterized protein LOC126686874 n=1 Tax=Mercurialis annua TaxID=3986 RepID=UPI002160478D|nr:uncharacterized protein LOC126686874 [Mercurialis annua]